jgi:hypothetical protein
VIVKSDATIGVYLSADRPTVADIRAWLAEVDRLHIPEDTVLDEGFVSVFYRSEIVDEIVSESALGVEGYDILVGLPR